MKMQLNELRFWENQEIQSQFLLSSVRTSQSHKSIAFFSEIIASGQQVAIVHAYGIATQ